MKLVIARPLLVVGLAALAAGTAAAAAPHAERPLDAARRLMVDSSDSARVSLNRTTGTADLVRLEPGALHLSGSTPRDRGLDFLSRYKALFGVADPYRELEEVGRGVDHLGRTHLRFRQVFDGLPVVGGELRAHFDREGRLTAVNGLFVSGVEVDPAPSLPGGTAEGIAAAAVAKRAGRPIASLEISPARLVVFRDGLLWGRSGADHLAWETVVVGDAGFAERLYVDAHDGVVLERISLTHDLTRRVSKTTPGNVVWQEGDPLPYSGDTADANAEINQLITTAGESYALFANLSGGSFLSWDAHDAEMRTLYDPAASEQPSDDFCPNAAWIGADRRMVACTGTVTDDVVAHEWTHAYTDSTDALVYMWQSGALNESFSDIFGETVDQLNGLGMDTPDAHRTDGACSAFGASPYPDLSIESPSSIAGSYYAGGAEFNPAPPYSVSARVELVDDGTDPSSNGCEALTGFTSGRIALIDRGDCNFIDKVQHAQDAGAAGVIVANNQGEDLINMARPEGSTTVLSIPAAFVRQSDGQAIKDALDDSVQATISLAAPSDQSVRWLIGEDIDGGAIRDMYNPSCFHDPGRVPDKAYYCGVDDNGGVHVNSGIPNHAYALLVDGGTYNGRTVRGVGFTKASNIYWRAMSVYQVPVTDFALHADLVELSCSDLVGAPLRDPTGGGVSGQVITDSDCAQVTQAMLAVEMATYPSQCTFPPLLKTGAPAFVGNRIALFADFDGGPPAGWTLTNQGVNGEYQPRDWQWTDHLPAGGKGGAYFAADNPLVGDCIVGSDDQSGVVRLESPAITVPTGSSPTLAFDHWVATERRFDGGLLQISVNGGDFQIVPRSAFTFNSYNLPMESAANGNTNPLAGKYAFTGTDTGTSRGSWGQSQVDLSGLVKAGDTIRVRFDFGTDGCNGVVGWYVDDVQVRTTDLQPRTANVRVQP